MAEHVWPDDLQGRAVVDEQGGRIGVVRSVYTPGAGGDPDWISVQVEDSETPERMVPLAAAELRDGAVTVPYSLEHVRAAPTVGGAGHLTSVDEAELNAHFGLEYRTAESELGLPSSGLPPAAAPMHESHDETGEHRQ